MKFIRFNILFVLIVSSWVLLNHQQAYAQLDSNNSSDSKNISQNNYKSNLWIEWSGRVHTSRTRFFIKPDSGKDKNIFNDYSVINPLSLKFGFNVLTLKEIPISLYINSNVIVDALSDEWNNLDWNNNYVFGPGIRAEIYKEPDKFFLDKLKFNLFAEYLNIGYLPKVKSSTTHRPKDDFILGFSLWTKFRGFPYTFSESDFLGILTNNWWIETDLNYSYSKSNFFVNDFENFHVLKASTILGLEAFYNIDVSENSKTKIRKDIEISFLDIYYKTLLIFDIGNNIWNKIDWNNNIKYGPGVNIFKYVLEHKNTGNSDGLIKHSKFLKSIKFELFYEYLNIYYLPKVEYIPSYKPNHDYFIGFRFWSFWGK